MNLKIGDSVRIFNLTQLHPDLLEGTEGRIVELFPEEPDMYRVDFWFTRKKLPIESFREIIPKEDPNIIETTGKEKEDINEIPMMNEMTDEEYEELFQEEQVKEDVVNRPKHYTHSKFETIEVIKEWGGKEHYEGFCWGNIIKYTSRYKHKNGLEDLKKARYYLDRLIESKDNG